MSTQVDVVVLGLGPGGEYVATELAKAGLVVAAIDKHLAGGECPYYGCIPTKMMVRAAAVLAEGHRIPDLAGTSTIAADWAPVARRISDEATTDWNDEAAVDRLVDSGVTFVRGHGRLAGPGAVEVASETFQASRAVVLNTGTEPVEPSIPGLHESPYWTNRDAVQLKELPASLIVIGGGAIGAELAQAFRRFGVSVTVLEGGERILALEEPEASAIVAETFDGAGIKVVTKANATHVRYADEQFTVTLDGQALSAERLLVATGRRPNLADIGLDTVGLDPEAKALDVDDRLAAGPGLWALGDITGKGGFTHVSMYQAAIVVSSILGDNAVAAADYRAVPRVTFTDPEVGSVGITEAQARERGISVRVGSTGAGPSTRAWIHGAGGAELVKLVEDADRGVLVGATAVGPYGGEVLSALTVAVHGEVPTARLASMIYAYPTFHRAIEAAVKDLAT